MVDMGPPHQMILEFLETADPNIRGKYQAYREMKLDPMPDISMTTLDKQESNEFFSFLLRAEVGFRQGMEQNLELVNWDFLSACGLAFFMNTLEETDVVDPNGQVLDSDINNLYAKEIANDPTSFWDIFYEIEVANHFVQQGLEAYPVDESAILGSGPDVLYKSTERDFWVECKNKHASTGHEWELERLGKEIADTLWTDLNLKDDTGEDSFVVRIETEEDIADTIFGNSKRDDQENIREQFIDEVSGKLAYLISDADSSIIEYEFEDILLRCELVDYFEGRHRIKLTDDQMDALQQRGNASEIIDPFDHLDFNPDVTDTNGHAVNHIEDVGNNVIEVFDTYAFIFDIPWDIPYHNWVYSTIDGVTKQFPDYSDIIIFVKVLPGIVNQMKKENTENHRGKSVTKWKRLEERIIGLYSNPDRSNRVKAVVITTDMIFNQDDSGGRKKWLENPMKLVVNKNVEEQIPEEFINLVDNKPQIDEIFGQVERKSGLAGLRQQWP